MSTQDFIYPKRIDSPRHDQNMPEGIETPAPKVWKAVRPGDSKNKSKAADNKLIGHAGPNSGFAMTLAARQSKEFVLASNEHSHDVEVILAEIAMRRASHFGRAPIRADIDFASHLFGFDVQPAKGIEDWRPNLVAGLGHEEHLMRLIVNSIPPEMITGNQFPTKGSISNWQQSLIDNN